jgi:NADH dehydrogenase
VEEAVKASGMSHAIIRPTVVFGPEDILVNNIAWFLRRFPVFPVFGSGRYAVQPVFVEDLAEIAVDAAQASGDVEMDAVGPETLTFNEMLSLIGDSIGSRTLFTHLPPALAYGLSGLVGYVVRDVVITRDEIEGLMAGLLVSTGRPTADTRLSEWLSLNAETIGARYASELRQHYR